MKLYEETKKIIQDTYNRYLTMGYTEQQANALISQSAKSFEERAKNNLILNFVLEKIVEKEKIEISENEIEEKIKEYAKKYRMDEEKVREYYDENDNKEHLINNLKLEKAIDFIVNNAIIKEVEKAEENRKEN